MQCDICGAALEEGGVEMILQIPGRMVNHWVRGVWGGDGERRERIRVHSSGRFMWARVGGQPRRESYKRRSTSLLLSYPWHTHKQIRKILASPSSHPLLSPQPNTSRQIQADSLFQTHPQSTQLSVPRDPISGQTSTIGISTRRVLQRYLHLLLPTSSPKLSSTLRRG